MYSKDQTESIVHVYTSAVEEDYLWISAEC